MMRLCRMYPDDLWSCYRPLGLRAGGYIAASGGLCIRRLAAMPAITNDRPAIQAMVLEDAAENRRREISRMPTAAQVEAIDVGLQTAFDELEMVAYCVEMVAESDDGTDLQFQIGLDDLGVLYVLSAEVRSRLDELDRELKRIDCAAFSLACIRRVQTAKAAKDA